MMTSFASYEIPHEQPYDEDAGWMESLQCDEGYVGDDGCTWAGKLLVTGQMAWHLYKDGSTDIESKLFDWVCPECGHEYHVEIS